MTSDLRDLYQQIILDHSRQPRNFRVIPDASRVVDGVNPLCGDRITLYLAIQGDRITEASFQGVGCAISQSSASLMTSTIAGLTIKQAEQLGEEFRSLVTTGIGPAGRGSLGKLAAFEGVREFPARVKCASLCWHALRSALRGDQVPVSTE